MYYGRTLNMSKEEILITTVGEMQDMIACMAIVNGVAKEKKKLTFDEALALR